MRKLVIVLGALVFLLGTFSVSWAQDEFTPSVIGAVRLTNCVGFQTGNTILDTPILCNVSGFAQANGFGVFAQVTPRYGPAWENWQFRGYRTDLNWDVGAAFRVEQVGLTVGRELGNYFVRFETDILIEFSF